MHEPVYVALAPVRRRQQALFVLRASVQGLLVGSLLGLAVGLGRWWAGWSFAPWLVVAGLIEGFLTPTGLSLAGALAIGAAVAGVYWLLVLLLGRPTRAPAPSP